MPKKPEAEKLRVEFNIYRIAVLLQSGMIKQSPSAAKADLALF